MSIQTRSGTKQLHRSRIRRIHAGWLIVFAAFMLMLIGVEAIDTTRPSTASRQLLLGVVGMICAFVIAFIPQKRFRQASWWLYVLSVLLLLFLLLPGVPDFIVHPRNGARRWINFGLTDMQPSELAKVAFVFAMASHLRFKNHYRKFNGLALAFIVAIPPMFLVFIEPDLGTAMIYLSIIIPMLFWSGFGRGLIFLWIEWDFKKFLSQNGENRGFLVFF